MLFRRKDQSPTPESAEPANPDKKGRPTPTRKEAEAAAKARAKASARGTAGKSGRQASRQMRAESSRKMREAMKTGDERYLPARDQGPVRHFIRDMIDVRLSVAEFLMPLLIVVLVASVTGQVALANGVWTATILLTIVDTIWLLFRLRRELRRRFPDTSTRGSTTYALLRVMQLRFMRLPKPQVKIGQALPTKY